jgi:hypothetical protein
MAINNLKVSDLLRAFNGEGDVIQWLTKIELVAELKGAKDLSQLLPLFLEGPAFAVYNEMSDVGKKSATEIVKVLTETFSLNPFVAYEQFVRRVWRDEPVDVYMTDLRRLARVGGVTSDALLKRAFVVGLPGPVSRELRAMENIDTVPLVTVLDRARALMTEHTENTVAAVALTAKRGESDRVVSKNSNRVDGLARRCYRCGGPHLQRFCKEEKFVVSCWTCGKEGHMARECEGQGNGSGRTGTPVVLPRGD